MCVCVVPVGAMRMYLCVWVCVWVPSWEKALDDIKSHQRIVLLLFSCATGYVVVCVSRELPPPPSHTSSKSARLSCLSRCSGPAPSSGAAAGLHQGHPLREPEQAVLRAAAQHHPGLPQHSSQEHPLQHAG